MLIDNYNYERILSFKTSYKINIIERYGLTKLKYYSRKLYLLIIFLILGIIINIILSKMIFKIEVVHPNKEIRELVLKDLDELGLKKYHFKVSYQRKELIRRKLLEKEKIIDWLEIDESGTKYIVRVEEKKFTKEKEKCMPRNIVAKKNALILDIDAYSGEVKKSVNNYVSKGEVIISGFIYNKEDIVSKRCALGKVYGETWYQIKVIIPKSKKEIKILDNYQKGLTIEFLNKKYNFNKPLGTYKKNSYYIIDSNFIPIKYSLNKYYKTKVSYKKLTDLEIEKKAFQIVAKEMRKRLNKDEKVLKKKILKKTEKDSKIEIDVFVSVKEDITAYQDITKIDITEMNKKEE